MSRAKSINYHYEPLEPQQNHNVFIEEYFSGPDTRIYFEGEEMYEISNLSFSVQEQLKPIYGYASRTFDDVAIGSRVILGSFTVPLGNHTRNNFIAEDYDGNNDPTPERISRPSWVEEVEQYTKQPEIAALPEVQEIQTIQIFYAPYQTEIRFAPNEQVPAIGILEEEAGFEVVGEIGDWIQIKTAETTGFVKKDLLF